MTRGQALVEFALTLPIFLFLILGSFHLALLMSTRVALEHAVREGAVAGALSSVTRCQIASSTVPIILGEAVTDIQCRITPSHVEVIATDESPRLLPWLPTTVTVTERAVFRPIPSPGA